MYDITRWKYMSKLDPAKSISDGNLEALRMSNTDAIIIGGTDDVIEDNVIHLMSRIRCYPLPLVLEVSNVESVMPGLDLYFIPTVMDSKDTKYHDKILLEILKKYGHVINFDGVFFEGCVVLSANSKVAKITKAYTQLGIENAKVYAQMAGESYRFPIMYVEYNGMYEDVDKVKAIANTPQHIQLFYGGGITNIDKADEMSDVADTIVVGDIIYNDTKKALRTVKTRESSR